MPTLPLAQQRVVDGLTNPKTVGYETKDLDHNNISIQHIFRVSKQAELRD